MPDDDKTSNGSQAAGSLYAWWMNAVPSFSGLASTAGPFAGAPATPADGAARSGALGPVPDALDMARRLLGPLYEASLQALLAHPQPGLAFGDVLEQARSRLQNLADTLASARQLVPAAAGMPWLGAHALSDPLAAVGEALKPLSLNLERAYGGLADAFGLAQSRELQQAARELMVGSAARAQVQAQYLAIVAAALAKGVDATLARLREMGRRGESVDSLLGLVRVWAQSTDHAVHAALQGQDALDAAARLLRASTASRRQLQRVVAIASATLNVPTHAEVDEAYREIQELKRELRRLRKAGPQTGVAPSIQPAAAVGETQALRRRPPAAKKSAPRKVPTPPRPASKAAGGRVRRTEEVR